MILAVQLRLWTTPTMACELRAVSSSPAPEQAAAYLDSAPVAAGVIQRMAFIAGQKMSGWRPCGAGRGGLRSGLPGPPDLRHCYARRLTVAARGTPHPAQAPCAVVRPERHRVAPAAGIQRQPAMPPVVPSGRRSRVPAAAAGLLRPPHRAALCEAPRITVDAPSVVDTPGVHSACDWRHR